MTKRAVLPLQILLLLVVSAGIASAQGATPPSSSSSDGWQPWIVVGGSSTTLLGDCTDCPADTYIHDGGVLGIVGTPLTPRTDIGAQVFWVPTSSAAGDPINTTYVMGTFQFRPWGSSGFFVRISSGMAFVRNWVVDTDTSTSFTSKAFALEIGGGWEWRFARHFGTQVFGSQHVAALGDLETATTRVENVMGNFWSVGGGIVIR
ncbi:MAG TPA: hypothetical protein VIZ32_08010 [Vicinamibacterales bacterium]